MIRTVIQIVITNQSQNVLDCLLSQGSTPPNNVMNIHLQHFSNFVLFNDHKRPISRKCLESGKNDPWSGSTHYNRFLANFIIIGQQRFK